MNRLKHFILISLLAISNIILAQTVSLSGKIVDSKKKGIKDVSIRIDGMQGVSAYTNERGEFAIDVEPSKIYTLRIVYAGKDPIVENVAIGAIDKFIGTYVLKQSEFGPVQVEYIRPGEFVDRFPPVDLAR
ncbi:MAG: hypothetical protein ACI857_003413, partial [Arenicella sp.]